MSFVMCNRNELLGGFKICFFLESMNLSESFGAIH
jgi:hypothetical protein